VTGGKNIPMLNYMQRYEDVLGRTGIAPRIQNLGTRLVVNTFAIKKTAPGTNRTGRWVGFKSRSTVGYEEKNHCPCWESNPGRAARSTVTILTDCSAPNAVRGFPNITPTRCFNIRLYTKRCKHSQTALVLNMWATSLCSDGLSAGRRTRRNLFKCTHSCVMSVVTTPNTALIQTFCWRARPNLTGVTRVMICLSSLI
jgi:hypothetical protein